MSTQQLASDVVVVGGGLAGLIATLECLQAGKRVILVDRDRRERLGGLALWAFGGMALVDTPLQRRMGIRDTPAIALRDWLRFGELDPQDTWALAWAKHYVEQVRSEVYDWLTAQGLRFMPAVNWVERGLYGDGNSLPRYHVLWGTSQHLTHQIIDRVLAVGGQGRLTLRCGHRVTALETKAGHLDAVVAVDEQSGTSVRLSAPVVVVATGGINGSHAQVKANWPTYMPRPAQMLNGAHPFADGHIHHQVAALGGQITHAGEMWNYAAGIPHPEPHFSGHGLSLIPCKSALWLNHRGERIGPQPLVTGFDTHALCQTVAAQEQPWTWQLLNWRIAIKELAVSGAEHNPRIRDRQWLAFLKDTLFGNSQLVKQLIAQSPHVISAGTLFDLTKKMNALTGASHIDPTVLQATVDAFDANFAKRHQLHNDDQLRRIMHARQWGPDRLRTCVPAALQQSGSGPFIALQLQLITRKSLGGLQTDLQSRVLDAQGQALSGLYCVGEAAGFGGGGANGKRSLEGTFLPACILTAKAAARSITTGHGL